MEKESLEFYERVRQGYRDLAAHEPKRIVLIDGDQSPDKIENDIWSAISARFPQSAIQNPKS
jgi:dTMP kinase